MKFVYFILAVFFAVVPLMGQESVKMAQEGSTEVGRLDDPKVRRGAVKRTVKDFLEKYPQATLQDIYKNNFQDYFGPSHIMADREGVLTLNRIRTVARQTELSAQHAFADREGTPTREDLLQALNRISSMLYILMLREKAAYGTGETDTKNY